MQLNGFNSNNYRYFRNKETGKIRKYSNEELKRYLFGRNFTTLLMENMVEYKVKEYPTYMRFDIIEYIKMQDDIVFKYDSYIDLNFREEDFLLVTSWLKSKMESNEIPLHTFLLPTGAQSVRQYNLNKIQYIDQSECLSVIDLGKLLPTSLTLTNVNHLEKNTIQYAFLFNRPIEFRIPFKKGEIWKLSDIAIAFILLNQKFVDFFFHSEEILGQEKENLFCEEYKDNIPNTTIRYYKIKDEIKINELYELVGDYLIEKGKNNGFNSEIARFCGDLRICSYNPNNFNVDGSIKYFYVKYFDETCDIEMERELLKIADRLPQSISIRKIL